MTTIEERVVKLTFDNAQFKREIGPSLQALESLNKGLKLEGAKKAVAEVSTATRGLSLDHIGNSVDAIAHRFSAMSVVAITALSNITNKAINAGTQLVRSLTVAPISSGLEEYETNLNSIQTILANTAHEGATLKQVNQALAELNHYSDQTIYNFAEMARNIGTFTAAGVNLKTSTAAIKGIANLAAVSGSNSQQASTAMYQLSQALAAGKVSLMDWNSVVNAGMGGKVFQDALKETARVHGVAVDKIIKEEGSFRDSLQKGWITSEILTETLNKFTGDLSEKQLKAMGYNQKQIAEIQKMGKTAQDAATKVKTMSQLIGTLQEAAGSGWAQTWQTVFGDFEEAKTLFTNVNNVLGGFISASADARNKVLKDWKELGGRTAIINAISNAFKALVAFVKPIKDAFRSIFPPTTGKQLATLSKSIEMFTKNLIIGGETANKLKRTFAGVFAVFGIGYEILKEAVSLFIDLFFGVQQNTNGILDFTARVGDFLVNLHKAVKEGQGLRNFFDVIYRTLSRVGTALKNVASFIGDVFSGVDNLDVNTGAISKIAERFSPFTKIGDVIEKTWSKVGDVLAKVAKFFEPLAEKFKVFFDDLGVQISSSIGDIDYNAILDGVNAGLLGGLVILFKKFLDGGVGVDFGGGFLDGVKSSFEALTGTLTAMQNNIKADTLLKIAGAVSLLTVSVVALSLIDSKKLTSALAGVSVMFGQLAAGMYILDKLASGMGFVRLPAIATSLILLAAAVDLLAIAVAKLSALDWSELARGLTAVTVLIVALSGASKLMAGNAGGMIKAGAGLILLATAVNILVTAVKSLSELNWSELSKGLVGVGTLLASLALFTKFASVGKTGLIQGAGIILLAAGIKILASALKDIATMSWTDISKGLLTMAGALTAIGLALNLIPPSALLSAAGVFIVAASLSKMGDAVKSMGSLDWGTIGRGLTVMAGSLAAIALAIGLIPPTSLLSAAAVYIVAKALGSIGAAVQSMGGMSGGEIAKGLVTLAGALTIISAAMYAMTGALPGAAALLIVAGSLKMLAPVLTTFSEMSWGEMVKGLLMLAGVFAVLGVAGFALAPVVPVLLGLGASLTLIGIGVLAAGAGVLAFSVALTALSAAGGAATAALVAMVTGLLGLIPVAMQQIGIGMIEFAKAIITGGPAIIEAFVVVLESLVDASLRLQPKITKAFFEILVALLNATLKYTPTLTQAGVQIIVAFLNGISKNMNSMVTAAANVVVKFIEGVGKNQQKIIDAGVKMVVNFLNGVAKSIRENSDAVGKAGADVGIAIVQGMARGIGAGIGEVTAKAGEVARAALNKAKSVLGIHSPSREFEKLGKYVNAGFIKGLDGNKQQVIDTFNYMKTILSDTMKSSAEDVKQAEAKLKKLTSARKKDLDAIRETKAQLAEARKENQRTTAAYNTLNKNLSGYRDWLGRLATQYDQVTNRLKTAQDALAAAKKTRDDFSANIKSQYSDLPDITGETKLKDYIGDLRKQIDDTKTFAYAIQKLRDLGLSDQMYKELLSRGVSALPFVSQLLEGGKDKVSELNVLGKDLESAAGNLGKTASTQLYQAAVNAAEGLVKGLQNQQAAIEKQMDKIAEYMVKAIKTKLGIKSPSRVFAEIGEYSGEGLIRGLNGTAAAVSQSATNLGSDAILALRKSISGISDIVTDDIEASPTITPVLDLTNITAQADKIDQILGSRTVDVSSALSTAKQISATYKPQNQPVTEETKTQPERSVTFIQNNNSPKALSQAEIYRQTKNQISRAKEEMNKR